MSEIDYQKILNEIPDDTRTIAEKLGVTMRTVQSYKRGDLDVKPSMQKLIQFVYPKYFTANDEINVVREESTSYMSNSNMIIQELRDQMRILYHTIDTLNKKFNPKPDRLTSTA